MNINKKAIISTVILLLSYAFGSTAVYAQAKMTGDTAKPQSAKIFKFSDYPAEVVKLTPENRHKAITAGESDWKTQELLQYLEKENASFAGRYVIGGTSCGTGGCVFRVVLDLTTGKTIDSFGSTACYVLEADSDPINHIFSRPDSHLFAFVGDFGDGECTLNYYVEDNGKLTKIHSEPWDRRNVKEFEKQLNGNSNKAKQKTRNPAQHSRAKGNTSGRSAFGITVTRCQFEFDKQDFCVDERMQTFAEVVAKRKPNFDNDKLLYIFKGQAGAIISDAEREMYRAVVMDKKKKTVVPLRHALGHAYDESGDKRLAVNDRGETLEYRFDSHSNKLCFIGNIYAYRDSFSYHANAPKKFCFVYDGKTFEKIIN